MTTRVAWNKDKSASVVLAKLKEFTITNVEYKGHQNATWSVRGWYNKENFFEFGTFSSEEEARSFLTDIHKMF